MDAYQNPFSDNFILEDFLITLSQHHPIHQFDIWSSKGKVHLECSYLSKSVIPVKTGILSVSPL